MTYGVALLCLALVCVGAQNVPLTRHYLNETNPLATCNDGTSAVAYIRAGTGSGATRWVIRLQGGGWCYDEDSCTSRAKSSPYWVTSSLCPAELLDNQTISGVGHEGILSSDPTYNPYFYNWNHVWLWYCSSDSHVGNTTKSFNGWPFQGKNIVAAMMTLLQKTTSLPSATDVLLTGDSAGGVATVNNVDFIKSYVLAVAPSANYRAFVDCAWFLDIPAYGSSTFSFQMVAKSLLINYNAVYDASCVQFYGTGSAWKCFHTQYAWQHIETLAIYAEFQFDSANLGFDGVSYPFTNATQAWVDTFQVDMLTAQASVPYLFSASCYKHEVIDGTMFTSIHIGSTSISDAVGAWFFAGSPSSPPPPSRYVDTCKGFNCNPTCPAL